MVKVGIIGCGNISKFHYEGYEKAGAKIVHVCDIRIEAAEAVASRYGAKASVDYKDVLNDPEVDLVSVTTIASAHKEICLQAIAAGKGVVCEKTLTDNPVDSEEIARAAEAAGVFCATAYMKRYFPRPCSRPKRCSQIWVTSSAFTQDHGSIGITGMAKYMKCSKRIRRL